jgi:glycine C-acetyltransferase
MYDRMVAILGFPFTGFLQPVMLGDARLAGDMASRLLDRGVYVVGFSYPVVPKGAARIRVQLSAAHTPEQLRIAVDAFASVGRELGIIS